MAEFLTLCGKTIQTEMELMSTDSQKLLFFKKLN